MIGTIFSTVSKVIQGSQALKGKGIDIQRLEKEIEAGLHKDEAEIEKEAIKTKGKVIEGDQKSDIWIAKAWRPIVALGCFTLISYITIQIFNGKEIPESDLLTLIVTNAFIFIFGYGVDRLSRKPGNIINRLLKK